MKLPFAFEVEMQVPDIKGKISNKGVGQNDGQKLQFASEVEMQMPEIKCKISNKRRGEVGMGGQHD